MAGCCASQKARLCGRTRGRHVFGTLTSVDMAATTRFDVIMFYTKLMYYYSCVRNDHRQMQ